METFVFNRRKIAKTVIVIFFILLSLMCVVYAFFSIVNLVKIKNAFELTFSQIADEWSEGLSCLSLPDIEKGNSYLLDIQSVSDKTNKLVATYTPGENGGIGNLSFVNSSGEKANLYDIIGLVAGLKEEESITTSAIMKMNDIPNYKTLECFSSATQNSSNSFLQNISCVFGDDLSMPEINRKKLGYNAVLFLTKSDFKPGKTIYVSNKSQIVKARKYSVELKKEHLKDFIEKVTSDNSVENTQLVQYIKKSFLDLINDCQSGEFIISAVLHGGKVLSVECETPKTGGDSYLFSVGKGNNDGKIQFNLKNVSKDKDLMQLTAKCDGKKVDISYVNTNPKVTLNAKSEDDKMKLNFSGRGRLYLNLIAQKTDYSYNMKFYKDKLFKYQPFLDVRITKIN